MLGSSCTSTSSNRGSGGNGVGAGVVRRGAWGTSVSIRFTSGTGSVGVLDERMSLMKSSGPGIIVEAVRRVARSVAHRTVASLQAPIRSVQRSEQALFAAQQGLD